jgi:cobalt-zinc-cadmium efflux system membrane fusion protein
MLTRSSGALRRIQAMLVGLGLLTTLAAGALAHEGHDHGAPPPAAVTTSNPRVTAQSDAYELVGVLRGERLGLYLDRFATNEPVTDAKIAVTVGGDEEVQAERGSDGTYSLTSAKFAGEGPLELIFAVTAPAGDDLLIGTLQLPAKPAVAAPAPARPSPLQALQSVPSVRIGKADIPTPYVIAGVALALGFLLGLAARSRNKVVPAAGLALVALAVSTAYAFAHEGHDHGSEAAKAALPAG